MGTASTAASSRVWHWLLPLALALTGVALVAGARTAGGTDLRSDQRTRLVDLVVAENSTVDGLTATVDQLRRDVDAATVRAQSGPRATVLNAQVDRLGSAAGMSAVHGPGLEVTLDDAPVPAGGVTDGYVPDDYVVHQQDVQGVVNALWAGGAEAMQVMDQRIIATSAVRCVGNTLILQGRVYAPPFTITAIGPTDRMRRALDASPTIRLYRQWADLVGLEYGVTELDDVTLPGFEGSVDLTHARVAS
ncbi:MAG: DUF881 domain-containing protein [Actinomycetes bacterium]